VYCDHFIRMRIRSDVIDQRFLALLGSSSIIRKQIEGFFVSTAGQKTVNQRHISSIVLPLPPRPEQERIVAAIEQMFSRVDVAVTGLERVSRRLRNMRAAVLQSAVNGTLIDANTERWEHVTLGDLLDDIHAGRSFKCDERPARPDEWGVVKVSAMTWGEFRQDENKTVLSDRTVDPKLEIHPGDLLVSRANTVDYVGAVVLVRECRPKLLLSDKSLRLVPNSCVLPDWLVISLRAGPARRYIKSVATGTSDSMRNISQPKLRAVQVTLPPLDTQTQLVAEVDRMMSLIGDIERVVDQTMRRAAVLRSVILSMAFSGTLVPQDPNDEPASGLLERIASQRALADGRHNPGSNRRTRTVRRKVTA
jgi:type I restriction enzyme S subunit